MHALFVIVAGCKREEQNAFVNVAQFLAIKLV